jgi:hypothetical protein
MVEPTDEIVEIENAGLFVQAKSAYEEPRRLDKRISGKPIEKGIQKKKKPSGN